MKQAKGNNGDVPAKAEGRDQKSGRFIKGWKGGPGNPRYNQIADHNRAWREATTEADTLAVVAKLVEAARAGKEWAVTQYLDRVIGKAVQMISASISAETTTIINSLMLDDSTERAARIASIISSRLNGQEQAPALGSEADRLPEQEQQP